MTDLTPAQALTAAAEKLREAAVAAEVDAPSPWRSHLRYDDDPDSTVSLWDANKPLLHGAPSPRGRGPFVTGPVGRYIALLHPGVGLALADLLEQAARSHDAACTAAGRVFHDEPVARDAWIAEHTDEHALAVARAILTGGER